MTDVIKLRKCCLLDNGFSYTTEGILELEQVGLLKELNYQYVKDYDYMEIGLVDENNIVQYHCDNVHGRPNDFIEGFIRGIESTGVVVNIEECVLGEENFELIFI